eukprot:TRINITY_DN25216_c0_g1_i1.p1 TRINITY_DN25216_c0_g1~~TRINITY_DN25216_c0_g1_i1.p1  ORF type:complete len:403 (+),score=94.89 TRINITY_DN25216_c0_g1_i1:125-1333(+)
MARRRKDAKSSEESESRTRRKSQRSRSRRRRRARSRSCSDSSVEAPRKRSSPTKKVATASAAPKAAAKASVPDWLSDLFPGGGGGGAPEPQPAQAASHLFVPGQVSVLGGASKAAVAASSKPIVVPQHLVGLLAADNQQAVLDIQRATGADISLRQDTQHLGYSIAVISGTAQQVAAGEAMLKTKIGLGGGGAGTSATKEIDVQREHLDAILGPGGYALAEIRTRAGGIAVDFRMPQFANMPVKLIIGPGNSQNIITAEQLIRKKMADFDLNMLARRNRGQFAASLCPHYAKGYCTNGSNCLFIHVNDGEEVRPEDKLAAPCRAFQRGNCARGKACLYTHSEEELKAAIKSLAAATQKKPGTGAAHGHLALKNDTKETPKAEEKKEKKPEEEEVGETMGGFL